MSLRSMNTAVSGMQNHQAMLDTVSNNIANVDTYGFKSSRMAFKTILSQTMTGAGAPTASLGGTNSEQVGLGMTIDSTQQSMTQGNLQNTGVPTDVAIQGNGFFRVTADTTNIATNAEPVVYQRAGNFAFDKNGDLVTSDGYHVVGYKPILAGAPPVPTNVPDTTQDSVITVPPGSQSFSIDQTGKVTYVNAAGAQLTAGWISMATVPNPAGMAPIGGNKWTLSANSGAVNNNEPIPAGGVGVSGVPPVIQNTASIAGDANTGTGTLAVGELEASNVDLATEFTNMITAERGFEANSRVITTSDEILQTLDGLVH